MADFWKLNQTSTDGAIRYWDLIETMLAAGWTMRASGDGTDLWEFGDPVPPGVPVTHGGSGANGLGNDYAWVRMQAPDGGREVIIQRGTGSTHWTIVYSKAAKFIGGIPSGTERATATDEYIVAPNVALHATAEWRHHCWASNVFPYPFYLVTYASGGGVYTHLTMFEELDTFSGDTDPVIFIRGTSGTLSAMGTAIPGANTTTNLQASGWSKTTSVTFNVYQYSGSTAAAYTGFAATNAPAGFDDKDALAPCLVLRRGVDSDPMTKGVTKNFLATGASRSGGSTYTARIRIHLATTTGAFCLPWDGVTEPLI